MNDEPSIGSESRQQVRGSSMLLAGRIFALLLNLATQVLTVRYLSKTDYGAFAFAVAMVEMVSAASMLGLNKACSRFLPLYYERKDYARAFGTLWLILVTVFGLGLAAAVIVVASRDFLAEHVIGNSLSVTLLVVLIALAPLDAVDYIAESFFSVFGRVRMVLFRRHLLGPLCKLGAVAAVLAVQGSVQMMAVCYLVAGVVGFCFYAMAFFPVLREHQPQQALRLMHLRFPVGEVSRFSGPLLTSHVLFLLQMTLVVFLLELLSGSVAVAEYRAVASFARLNHVVFVSFSLLFMPLATRLYARRQATLLHGFYWQSVTWITLLTFPILAATAVFSEQITILLFGRRYAASSPVMTILAIACFVGGTWGLTSHVLRVYARIRYCVMADVASVITAAVLFWLLIPRYGARGAALAQIGAVLVECLSYAAATHRLTDVAALAPRRLALFGWVALMIGVLTWLQWAFRPSLPTAAIAVCTAWGFLMFWHRRDLQVARIYPGFIKFPVLGRWFVSPDVDREGAIP